MSSESKDDFDSSEEDSSYEDDGDTCGYGEIQSEFSKFRSFSQARVAKHSNYALKLDADSSFSKVAVVTSDNDVKVLTIRPGGLAETSEFIINPQKANTTVCDVKFAKNDDNVLYAACGDGFISVLDVRSKNRRCLPPEMKDNQRIPITCIDINANGRILCAGTERVVNDTFLLFYDIRKSKRLGGYSDSHEDNITAVEFHPTNPDSMATGSIDGLINIFDISEKSEDNALLTVINTEDCGVSKLKWHQNADQKSYTLSCVTDSNGLKLYEADEGDLIAEYETSAIADAIKRKSVANCYVTDCHRQADGRIFCLAGTNHKDKALRSVYVNEDGLKSYANYDGNKQIVRDSVYNAQTNTLVTAGENGIVSIWKEDSVPIKEEKPSTSNLKIKSELNKKARSNKPY